jgi:BMFP domain-containing protein YqiC
MDKPEADELLKRLLEGLPASLQAARADIEAHFSRVLLRSRELLAQLEARVAELEKR